MRSAILKKYIADGKLDSALCELYFGDISNTQKRYISAIENFEDIFGSDRDISVFSVPGRSELSGNHTDHNRGLVIAGSVDLDIIAVAAKRDDGRVCVKSERYDMICVDISSNTAPDPSLFGTSDSIILGMCCGLSDKGYFVGGFDAYMTSNVLKGSGLSSSAAFEDMIGNIENHFYNNGSIDNIQIAKTAQFAENVFFGKPCGLMDQVACAHGGIVTIDFKDANAPIIDKVDLDINAHGFRLCIINTGGNHADLTDDYAAIPSEMKSVAAAFGHDALRDITRDDVLNSISELRGKVGDRAILRAIHFFSENRRVRDQLEALSSGELDRYFDIVKMSGRSSFEYLQNVFTVKNTSEQGLSLALALCDIFLEGKRGAYRVHGGGFAGTVQAYVHKDDVEKFKEFIDSAFGCDACLVLNIRGKGAVKVI